jgi:hypothetical protein
LSGLAIRQIGGPSDLRLLGKLISSPLPRKEERIMKATTSRILALSTVILALAGAVAPSYAVDARIGTSGWWQEMDREGRGGNGGN